MIYRCRECGKTYDSPVPVLMVAHKCPKVETGKARVVRMVAT